jgi:hypothetical protein
LYEGAYVQAARSDPPLGNRKINDTIRESDIISVVGSEDSQNFMKSILADYEVAENMQTFPDFDKFRTEILKYDNYWDSNFTYAIQLDMNQDKTNIKFSTLSPSFSGGFTPFDVDNLTPVYSIGRFLGGNSRVAEYSSLIFEKIFQEDNLKLNLAYTSRSNYAYTISDLPQVMDQVFPIFIVIIYTLPYMYFLQRAVEEKQTKTRESMRMMGMIDSAYWTSWFIVYFFQVLIVSVIMTLGSIFTLFPGCNPLLIFILYFLYGMSIYGIGLIMVAIFGSVRTVAIGGLVLKLASYYLRYAFTSSTPLIWRLLASIFPPLNLYNVNYVLWQLQAFSSISFDNVNFVTREYSIAWFYIMCLVGFVFWLIVGLYITYIVPIEFGTRRHPCFCIMPRRRRARNNNRGERNSLLSVNGSDLGSGSEDEERKQNFERVGNDLKDLESTNQ